MWVVSREMKPLQANDLQDFTKRFQNFEDAQLRSLKVFSQTQMTLTLGVQDASRAYDWISLSLEFNDVKDASLVSDEQLPLIEMSEGASFGYNDCFKFQINSSTFFIEAQTIKYQEGNF